MSSNKTHSDRMLIAFGFALCCVAYLAHSLTQDRAELRALFDDKYQAWVEYTETHDRLSSQAGINGALYDIIGLGPPVIPYIIEKIEQNAYGLDFQLGHAVERITNKFFAIDDFPGGKPRDAHAKARMYVEWWRVRRRQTPELFEGYCAEWKSLENAGKEGEAQERLIMIKRLGIGILPQLMAKIEAGEQEFISIASWLTTTRGPTVLSPAAPDPSKVRIREDATISECLAWWAVNKEEWTFPPVEVREPGAESASGRAPAESETDDAQ